MKIDGYTRMAAVIAHPIRHSISPFIHNLAYELTATNAAYLAWDIAEEDLESTISQIRKLDMIGANISMPYKQKVFVNCSNKEKGPAVTKVCANSCIACGMCERTCKFDAIHVVDGVARVDYDKCKGCGMCAQKCPKKIILFPLKDDPYPPKPVVKPAAPAAAKPAAPAAKPEAEAKPETKAE